jgi:signal transduction histidine kinase
MSAELGSAAGRIGFFARSIPRRILVALLGIGFVTYLATAVVVYSGVRASMLESDSAALNHLADLKYQQLTNLIGALATDLTAWSQLEVMNDLASGDIDKRVTQTLEALRRLYGLSGDIYAFDAGGKLLASSRMGRINGAPTRLPARWLGGEHGLVFIDKHQDPMTGSPDVALGIPVFGTFDRHFRIGTLVLTYPWSAIEQILFSRVNGTILFESNGQTRILSANPQGIISRVGSERIRKNDWRGSGMVVGSSTSHLGLLANWHLLILHDTAAATQPLRRVAFELVLLGAALGIPIILLGRWLAHRLTAPIADLTRVVREIADTDKLDTRVPVTSSDELGSLAQLFNRMITSLERTTREREEFVCELAALNQTLEAKISARTEELEGAIRAQQRLLGDISHEIKSPLARLSMAVGLALRSAEAERPRQFDRMEQEIENISALASELLTLARLDAATAPPQFSPVDAGALIRQVVADAIYERPERSADIVFRAASRPATIVGNADLLRRAIENIVRNAIFYTTAGTQVEIAVLREEPRIVAIEVRDWGSGVPPTALGHLFEPFYRVDEARARDTGGTGIGLAICQRVVQLHGGTVSARNNIPHGLVVEIELPLPSADADISAVTPAAAPSVSAGVSR